MLKCCWFKITMKGNPEKRIDKCHGLESMFCLSNLGWECLQFGICFVNRLLILLPTNGSFPL